MKWFVKLTVGDFWLKMLALLVAWALWFVAREDVEEVFPVRPLAVIPIFDEKQFEVQVPDASQLVRLILRGSRTHRTQFEALEDPKITARIDGRIPEDVQEITLTLARGQLEFPEPVGKELRIEQMTPANGVQLHVYRVEERRIPVRAPDTSDIGIEFVQVHVIKSDPDLLVRARKRDLESLAEIETVIDRATIERQLRAMGETVTSQEFVVPLTIKAAPDLRLRMTFPDVRPGDPAALTANIRITREKAAEIVVPIVIAYWSPNGRLGLDDRRVTYHVDTTAEPWFNNDPKRPTVTLRIRGVPNIIDAVDPSKITAVVQAVDLGGETLKEVDLEMLGLPTGVELEQTYRVSLTSANR